MKKLQNLSGQLLRVLPKNHLSYAVGHLMGVKLPQPLGDVSVSWFAKHYNINMDEAERPLTEYRTINELFTRNLKPGVRPIQNGIVHPVDGRITSYGKIEKSTLIQAKDKSYKLSEFLASQEWAELFDEGSFYTYYLCPTDYHQIHAPVSGEVTEATYIPGKLWPVNDWSVSEISDLFSINERLVTYIKTSKGHVALVMVGATNVGKMTVSYDSTLVTNQLSDSKIVNKKYKSPSHISKGDKLGIFHMGSTVIMLYPRGFMEPVSSHPSGPVKLGETLGI